MCSMKNLGYKLGVLFAGISVLCGAVVYSSPGLANALLGYLTHSTWQYSIMQFDLLRFVGGAGLWFLIGAAIGFAFEKLCECKEGEIPSRGIRKSRKR